MVETHTINIESDGNCHIQDITSAVARAVGDSGLKNGIATVFVPGSTGGLTTVEFESGLVTDLEELFERIAPSSSSYHHDARWHDGNGHSHVRASLLGPSLTAPFVDGELTLGTWQQIIFIDFDNRPRSRRLIVQVLGE